MPSPFPGMDPYVEDPVQWESFHVVLITQLGIALNRVLPTTYLARVEQRLYVVQPDRSIVADVAVRTSRPSASSAFRGAVVVAEPSVPAADAAWEVDAEESFRESYVQILGPPPLRRVVCVVEALSPANKAAGTEGRRQYLAKQNEVLSSDAHLLEIDLLRTGDHTVAAPRSELLIRGAYDYLVCLSRADVRSRFTVWARTVRDRLPRFLVPLLPGDGQVVLDLQDLFTAAYDGGAYSRSIDYRSEAVPPLRPSDAEWARSFLR